MNKIFAVAAFVAVAFVGTALPASAKHGVDNPKPPVPVVVVPAPIVVPPVVVAPPVVAPPVVVVPVVPAPVVPVTPVAVSTGTVTVKGVCDQVTVTLSGYLPGTVAKIWWKFGRNNYSLAPNATLVDNGVKVVTTTRSTNFRDEVQTRVQIEEPGFAPFTVGGPSAYC